LWESLGEGVVFLEVGRDAATLLRLWLERYVAGRFGLNLLLHRLEDAGQPWPTTDIIGHVPGRPQTAAQTLPAPLEHVARHRTAIDPTDAARWLRAECTNLCDQRLELVKCESGFTRNMFFFLRHGLGQIDTLNPEQKAYDQSYLIVKRGRARGTQWLVEPG